MNVTTAIGQLFSMITVLFAAGEKVAKSLDNLATVAEETSGAYVDSARAEREQKLLKLQAATKETKAEVKQITKAA